MTERKSQKQEVRRETKHENTDIQKHQAGGPGKSARKGHVDPVHSGNKDEQNQSGPGAPHRKQ
ncbi:hypothetical protein C882_1815 [Caenispirillum salinarum AK4]|uniref:Uncharacterized protein n=1 Tax=Caenispirillum salinarum AK4 TaxID=1238182 RepID=K9H9M1_9PROT|nr:hypothetical protein [Caenispirillum salinarum]EKV27313.1 hypothetical protein C882_1815 [Caenispirillum salinarum AK4]